MFNNNCAYGLVGAGICGLATYGLASLVTGVKVNAKMRKGRKELNSIHEQLMNATTKEEQLRVSDDIVAWAHRYCG